MIENKKESRKSATITADFDPNSPAQKIYDYAEAKYGPGFAQYCADVLTAEEESPKARIPENHQMTTLIRLTNQLQALSQVCSADFFHEWGAEDKVFYMGILADVSNDLSQALHGSLKEIKASNDHQTSIPDTQKG